MRVDDATERFHMLPRPCFFSSCTKVFNSNHLSGLDGLASDGTADLSFGQFRGTCSARLLAAGTLTGPVVSAAVKRRAKEWQRHFISRSDAEVYSFHTATNLSDKEGDRLLSNVRMTIVLRKRHKIAKDEIFAKFSAE